MFKRLEKNICPFNQKKCIKDACQLWIKMEAMNSETKKLEDASNCAIVKGVEIQLENLYRTTGVQQAIESNRNESVKRQDFLLKFLISQSNKSNGQING